MVSTYVSPTQSGWYEYEVFLLDLTTGKNVSQDELLERYPISSDAITRGIANDFVRTVSIPWDNKYGWLDNNLIYYREAINPNQPDIAYYLNRDGDLCCIYKKYGAIPNSYFGRCNLIHYKESPDCQRLLDLLQ